MFSISFESNFDPMKLLLAAKEDVAKDIARKCELAATPFGGVTVSIERAPDGSPRKLLFCGNAEAVKAAEHALDADWKKAA